MMTKKNKIIKLDSYEEEILEAYENGQLKVSETSADYQAIASDTLKKNKKCKEVTE